MSDELVQVTVLVPGVLRAECGGAAHLEVKCRPTLGSLLEQLAQDWPRLHRRVRDEQGQLRRFVNVYVDGEDCRVSERLATPLRNGAEVQILPSVAGG
jgi:molybdopterin synthase sulfur carrier subunit